MNLQTLAVLYFLVPVGHVHIRTQHIRDREGWDVSQNIASCNCTGVCVWGGGEW